MLLAFSLVFNLPRIRCRFSSSPLRVQGAAFRPPCAPLESFRRFVGPGNFRGRLLNEFVGKIVPLRSLRAWSRRDQFSTALVESPPARRRRRLAERLRLRAELWFGDGGNHEAGLCRAAAQPAPHGDDVDLEGLASLGRRAGCVRPAVLVE